MRLLVTGGAGFIGSNFVRYWVEHHPDDQVVAFDVLTYAGNRPNLADVEDRITFVQGDIGDLEVVAKTLAEHEIDIIVNFAAESHNSLAILDPARFFRTNVLGTQTLAEAARRHGVTRFHHISTCEVYGDLPLDSDEVFTEETPYRPRTPYNASKAGADHAVRAYVETFALPATITNCCNNYGPYQFPEKVIPLFTAKALDDQPLPLYASTQNRREWLHVDDHCRAIELVLQHGVVGETYNVGSGVEASIEEIADAILAATGKPQSLKEIVPDRPSHDRRYLLDSSKIRRELGWEPTVPFEQGLADTVAWYTAHRSWWEPLLGRAPVVEGSWSAEPNPGTGLGSVSRPLRVLLTGGNGQLGRDLRDVLAGGVPDGGATGRRPPAYCRRWTPAPSRCCPPTSTPSTWSTAPRSGPPSTPSGPTSCCTAGPTRPSTPASPTLTRPSPSTPWAPATWPRRPQPSGPIWSTSPPTTSSTAPSTAPTSSGTRPIPAPSTAAASWAGSRRSTRWPARRPPSSARPG